ncbi:MAG: hypothetical protein J1G06_10840 [Oscillospiraceae bacterium]|nr:hypothetical protein [Oscillospiraceae bacterium]
MVGYVLKKSLSVLAKKPVVLWGVSLLCAIISLLVATAGSAVPLIAIPIILTLSAGMSAVYLDGYNERTVSSKQLFKGFSKDCLLRVTGGMCWYYLWVLIWELVPVVGIIKAYSYRFTPYILITRPEVDATDALKISMMETKGYKLMMFLTDLLIVAAIIVAMIVLALLSAIPYVGILFAVITVLFAIALVLFLPIFYGLVGAAFYQETRNGTFTAASYKPASYNTNAHPTFVAPVKTAEDTAIQPKEGDWYCAECDTLNAAGTKYCRACGAKYVEKPVETEPEETVIEPEPVEVAVEESTVEE